jgi:hypothetical protein
MQTFTNKNVLGQELREPYNKYNIESSDTNPSYADAYIPFVGHKISQDHNINNSISSSTLLETVDYRKRMQLLHNNIPDIPHRIKLERFTMIIDSMDRDFNLYPNPFEYKVSIGPQIQQKIMEYIRNSDGDAIIDPLTRQPIYSEKNIPTSGPVIGEPIFWIKRIELDSVVLPRAYTLDQNSLSNPKDHDYHHQTIIPMLDGDRCIQVAIPELQRKCKYSTNSNLSDAFAVLIDYQYSSNNFFMATNRCAGIDYSEPLDRLNNLSITFKDSNGNKLNYDYLKRCECCSNKNNTCFNYCCNPNYINKFYSYGGGIFIDFKKPKMHTVVFGGSLDISNNKFIDGSDVVDYKLVYNENNHYMLALIGTVLGYKVEHLMGIKLEELLNLY